MIYNNANYKINFINKQQQQQQQRSTTSNANINPSNE